MTITQTGVNIHVTYTEPTTTENGTPLDDLASTDTVVKDEGLSVVAVHQVLATAPTGGGFVEFDVVVDIPLGQKQTLSVEVTASDLVGNVSQPAVDVILIDREAPGVPQ